MAESTDGYLVNKVWGVGHEGNALILANKMRNLRSVGTMVSCIK